MAKIFNKVLVIIFLLLSTIVQAQTVDKLEINWTEAVKYGLEGRQMRDAIHFERAQYNFLESELPFFYQRIEQANGRYLLSAQLENMQFETFDSEDAELLREVKDIPSTIKVSVENATIRKENVPYIRFTPVRRSSSGQLEKLVSADLRLNYSSTSLNRLSRRKSLNFASQSVLRSGNWYKLGVTKDGVVKLDYSFLKRLGMDLENIDPRRIALFGYGGGMLPRENDEPRPDDLVENAIQVVGENDGVFNKSDYILFYGEDQVVWFYDSTESHFRHRLHTYADTTYYYLTVDHGAGKRIPQASDPGLVPNQIVSSYDEYKYYENDISNLLKSGQMWVGEDFDDRNAKVFSFNFPNIVTTEPGSFEIYGVGRAGVTSLFNISVSNQNFSLAIGATVLSRYEVGFARLNRQIYSFNPSSSSLPFSIAYSKPQTVSKGWLNYLNVNVRSRLNLIENQMLFRDSRSAGIGNVSQFVVTSSKLPRVWDITDKYNVVERVLIRSGSQNSFIVQTPTLREFVAFTEADTLFVHPIGQVPNQNLHALGAADLLIITHPLFMNEALDLQSIHSARGLRVHTVTAQQIYNEFSAGAQDIIALRSYIKMFYDRAASTADIPKYVMLIGDASYDMKNRINGNTNFVLGFQSSNSLQPTASYISDDYIALLDDNEGPWFTNTSTPDKIDVGVGRLPVKTKAEARAVVEKIRAYVQPSALGDWRNKIVFVADDEDGGIHMSQADDLTRISQREDEAYNLVKLYLDAFQQVSTSSGPRYPEVNERISQAVESGSLIINYTGHGGETGWAGERVLDIQTINSWTNNQKLPLFVTATCEFSRFDDPFRTSGGELVLLNPNGGGIGLLTTTRLVFSSPNYLLNKSFYNKLFDRKADGTHYSFGELSMIVKNDNANQSNTRNFALLGDPSLTPSLPFYDVATTEVNGIPIGSGVDTLNALSKATIKGYIVDLNGNKLSNFNGVIYPTVYDKEKRVQTLNNDGGAPFRYDKRDNILFRGKASVVNGDFSFEFVVPKDISYSFGEGKVSYYSNNSSVDANGYTTNLLIGGSNPNAIVDELGPQIDLFMNDESFVFGGITDDNPILLAKLNDEQGINTVGNGIGHDIVAILDGNTEDAIVLNDFYEADLDNYQSGVVRFPFKELSEGKHTITLKAWDVANNSSESTIEFTVVESKEIKIENLVNYPNPFTTNTEFIFQHNQPGIPLDVRLEIFTVSGKLVKSFSEVIVNEGFLSRDIRWNGRDDFGDKIGKGVYVYKLKVRSRNGSVTEKYEKLVIL